jgi:hypothetical protein
LKRAGYSGRGRKDMPIAKNKACLVGFGTGKRQPLPRCIALA